MTVTWSWPLERQAMAAAVAPGSDATAEGARAIPVTTGALYHGPLHAGTQKPPCHEGVTQKSLSCREASAPALRSGGASARSRSLSSISRTKGDTFARVAF